LTKEVPILYSFRRCPYAIRARWALIASNIDVELREIVLKDKPNEFLSVSTSATVPCLQLKEKIIDGIEIVVEPALELAMMTQNNEFKIPRNFIMNIFKICRPKN